MQSECKCSPFRQKFGMVQIYKQTFCSFQYGLIESDRFGLKRQECLEDLMLILNINSRDKLTFSCMYQWIYT